MLIWTRRISVAATLVVTGCTGTIENDSEEGKRPSGTPGPASPGPGAPAPGPGTPETGNPTPGTPGTGNPGTPGTPGTPGCSEVVPVTSQLPRLTGAQYDATIRDLTGLESQPSTLLAPDSVGSVDQRAWDGYQAAAEALAAQVMATASAKAKVIPCTPAGDGAACARQLIEQFGQRVFRRPLTSEEIARYEALYADRANITASGTFDEAAQLLIRAFLQAPSFVTRAELAQTADGAYFSLTPYEVASRLSYMLWDSTPDDALYTAAAAGALSTPAGILEQAKRMLLDPKARTKVGQFHERYARMGTGTRWAAIQRDPAVYPAFKESLVPALSEETKRLFDHVVFDLGGSFKDLLTTPFAFVNSALAPLYGLDAAQYGSDLQKVSLDPATRAGVFTRAGFLTAYSLYNRPSAILRGAFLQKEVLCRSLGSPPDTAESTPLPTAGLATNRERTDAQTSAAECAGCHVNIINPTGFALEAFDAIGSFQATEKDTGAAINTAATVLIGTAAVEVKGPSDLMNAIASSPEAQSCYAKHWVEFAYDRVIPEDSCTVQNMASKLTQSGYTVLNLVADLTQTPSFRLRAAEVTP
jgi:hypothetical protein